MVLNTNYVFHLLSALVYSRCCEKKSCGNKNETPSDPVIVDRYETVTYCNKCCKICSHVVLANKKSSLRGLFILLD